MLNRTRALVTGIAVPVALFSGGGVQAQTVIDLTHPIPTFQQSADNPARPARVLALRS